MNLVCSDVVDQLRPSEKITMICTSNPLQELLMSAYKHPSTVASRENGRSKAKAARAQQQKAAVVNEKERDFEIDRLYQNQAREALNHFGFKKNQTKKETESDPSSENTNSS